LQLFLYLQVLDFLTTMVGLKYGLGEASPFIRSLMHLGPAAAVILSKGVAVALALLCIRINKAHLIRRANIWYAALVVWNLALIWGVKPPA
jgi:hypothetical protein